MKKDYYLQSVPLEEALNILKDVHKSSSYVPQKETISVYDSLHRIAFSSVYAKVSSPSYNEFPICPVCNHLLNEPTFGYCPKCGTPLENG